MRRQVGERNWRKVAEEGIQGVYEATETVWTREYCRALESIGCSTFVIAGSEYTTDGLQDRVIYGGFFGAFVEFKGPTTRVSPAQGRVALKMWARRPYTNFFMRRVAGTFLATLYLGNDPSFERPVGVLRTPREFVRKMQEISLEGMRRILAAESDLRSGKKVEFAWP